MNYILPWEYNRLLNRIIFLFAKIIVRGIIH